MKLKGHALELWRGKRKKEKNPGLPLFRVDIEKVTFLLYIDSSSEQQRRLKNTVIFLLLLT